MGFVQWEQGSSSKDYVPWANEYVNTHPENIGNVYDVKHITLSGKGLIVETELFSAWIFKSKPMYGFLIQFASAWCTSKKESPVLQLKLVEEDPYWVIGNDDSRLARWEKFANNKGFSQWYPRQEDEPSYAYNPLPLPTSESPSVNAHAQEDDTSYMNIIGEQSKNGKMRHKKGATTPPSPGEG